MEYSVGVQIEATPRVLDQALLGLGTHRRTRGRRSALVIPSRSRNGALVMLFRTHVIAESNALSALRASIRSDAAVNGRVSQDGAVNTGSSSSSCTDWREPAR